MASKKDQDMEDKSNKKNSEQDLKSAYQKARQEAKDAQRVAEKEKKTRLEIEKESQNSQELAESFQRELQQERQARAKAEQQLEEVEKEFASLKVEIEEERQARATSDQELMETKNLLETAGKESPPTKDDEKLAADSKDTEGEHPVSFVMRLTVNDVGQPLRTEIQHVQSQEKQVFATLDLNRLEKFVKSKIEAGIVPEVPVQPPPEPTKENEVEHSDIEKGKLGLSISNVRLYAKGSHGTMSAAFDAAEALFIEVSFGLQGSQARIYAEEEREYEVSVNATTIASGESKQIAIQKGTLKAHILDYKTRMHIWGLSPGLYRLMTFVTIPGRNPVGSFFEGPILKIMEPTQIAPAQTA